MRIDPDDFFAWVYMALYGAMTLTAVSGLFAVSYKIISWGLE